MVALGVAVVVAVPEYWRQRSRTTDGGLLVLMGLGVLVVISSVLPSITRAPAGLGALP